MTLQHIHILVIDDDPQMRTFLQHALQNPNVQVVVAANGEEGLTCYAQQAFDVVFLDYHMPISHGIDVLKKLIDVDPDVTVVMMTGYGTIETAVEAMKVGAVDFLTKPLDIDHLDIVLHKVLKNKEQVKKLRLMEAQVGRQGSFEGLVGVSSKMQALYALLERFASSSATVLIQGETGTGKELVARAVHNLSPRKNKTFLPINCGALSEPLLESELFGHEKGAFTGAIRKKLGLFGQAEGGTVFLDEIEAMPPALQVKLLRTLQEKEVMPVGGDQPVAVDFRVVASTNVSLLTLKESNTLREDLYYRLSVAHIDLPPLRQRREDIPLLAKHFLVRYGNESAEIVESIGPEAMMMLKAYDWPGNVRELENTIHQSVLLCENNRIELTDLPQHIRGTQDEVPMETNLFDQPFAEARSAFEKRYLEAMLDLAEGRVADAAKRAEMHRQQFYAKMKQYDISR